MSAFLVKDLRPEWVRRDVAAGWRFSYEHHMVSARNPAGGQFTVFGDLKYLPPHMQPEKRDELGKAIAAWLNGEEYEGSWIET